MLPNCLSVHSNMAPAAQVRRQERGDRGEGVASVGWGGESVPHSLFPSFSLPFFSCDGCKAVDHAPDLSVFLIKILYLQAREEKKKRWKALSKQSVMRREEERGHRRHIHAMRHTRQL